VPISNLDLDPLLQTLTKISHGRILAAAEIMREGDITIARIPIKYFHQEDKTDKSIRRFISDWIKRHCKNTAVDARIEKFPPGITWDDDENGDQTLIRGALKVSWWPKPHETEFEQWNRLRQTPKVAES